MLFEILHQKKKKKKFEISKFYNNSRGCVRGQTTISYNRVLETRFLKSSLRDSIFNLWSTSCHMVRVATEHFSLYNVGLGSLRFFPPKNLVVLSSSLSLSLSLFHSHTKLTLHIFTSSCEVRFLTLSSCQLHIYVLLGFFMGMYIMTSFFFFGLVWFDIVLYIFYSMI